MASRAGGSAPPAQADAVTTPSTAVSARAATSLTTAEPRTVAPPDVDAGAPAPEAPSRDAALDLLRAAALARVVAWHAVAATWLTAIAAIPLMFFVAGSLLGTSLNGRPYRQVLARRTVRVLIPLWVYGAVVAAAGAWQAHLDGVRIGLDVSGLAHALSWIFPVTDPAPSSWHDGWLSNHLWYLRAYLWVLVLAPVLAAAARRLVTSIVVFAALIMLIEAGRWTTVPVVDGGTARLVIGDVVTYGFFAMLGMAYRRARFTPARRDLRTCALLCAAAAVVFARVAGLPDGGVNASYVAVTLTGLAWLLAAGSVEHHLRDIAERPAVRAITSAISRRAVTIYLWHPPAIVVAHALVDGRSPTPSLAVLALTPLLTACAVAVVGFVEDIGARRRVPRLHVPTARAASLAGAIVVVVALATPVVAEPVLVADVAGASQPSRSSRRPPSYREALTNTSFAAAVHDTPAPIRLRDGRMPARQLQRAVDRWRRAHPEVASVGVALVAGGKEWTGASHRDGADPIDPRATYPTRSLTKLFTSALVLRAAEQGQVDLDAVAPRLRGIRYPRRVPAFTVRQLLQHTSGLVDYRSAPGYGRYDEVSPRLAVALALRAPLLSTPGTQVHYSSSNHLYLALLLEDVTGRSYADLVADLVRPLHLERITVGQPPSPGWVGHGASGVYAAPLDLARWLRALLTPGRVLPAPVVAAMQTLGEHNLGLGTWPLCPCWTDRAGVRRSTGYGHHVGDGGLYHDPAGATFAIRIEPPSPHNQAYVETLQQLLTMVLRR